MSFPFLTTPFGENRGPGDDLVPRTGVEDPTRGGTFRGTAASSPDFDLDLVLELEEERAAIAWIDGGCCED